MVKLRHCRHCNSWNAVFVCPNCNEETRCSEIADNWSIGLEDLDDYPLLECGFCGYVAEVGELLKETPVEVTFSVCGDENDEPDSSETSSNEPSYVPSFDI